REFPSRRPCDVKTPFWYHDRMRAKHADAGRQRRTRAGQHPKARRSATTYRLAPHFHRGLVLLGQVRKMPLNRMVNEAVGEYLESRTAAVEADLVETLRHVRAYRQADSDFESAIARFAEAEAGSAGHDPAEGKPARP